MSLNHNKKTLTTYLEQDLINAIKIQAIKENKSLAQLLSEIIRSYLEQISEES